MSVVYNLGLRIRNDLDYVGWGVKFYSNLLIH